MRSLIVGLLLTLALAQANIVSAAIGTYWELDPQQRYTDISGQLSITVGTPFAIPSPQSTAPWLFPSMYTMPDGSIQLIYHKDDDVPGAQRLLVRSTDQGLTWQGAPSPVRRYDLGGNIRRADGSVAVLAYDMYAFVKSGNTAVAQMSVSNDGGATFGPIQLATFSSPANTLNYTMSWSEAWPYLSTSAQWSRQVKSYLWRDVVQLPDGTLLAGGYNQFQSSEMWGAFCFRSTDYGLTWGSPSVMGYDPNGWGEGFDESGMSLTSTGDVLAVMRTGSYCPLMQSRSTDGGVTWQTPTPTGVSGVDPDLLLMSNGVLVCSHGRPGNRLMFSADGTGTNWTDQLQLCEYDVVEESSGYTGLVQVAPDRLLMVYDRNSSGQMSLEGVFITVTKVPPGDLNGDGTVGAADLDIIRAHWGQSVPVGNWLKGDPSGDGAVGAADLDILRAHWGEHSPPPPGSVPEPTFLVALSGAVLAGLLIRSSRLRRPRRQRP